MKYLTLPTQAWVTKMIIYIFLYMVLFGVLASIFLLTPTPNDDYTGLRLVIITFASILLTKYFIYMFFSPWNEVVLLNKRRQFEEKYRNVTYNPLVSILVPSWNEEDGVITTVEALLKSSYTNIEILIIDNASKDNTVSNVAALIARHKKQTQGTTLPIKIRYAYEGTQGKGHALNHGLQIAKGDIILSIDADCYVPPDSVANFVKYFKDPNVMAAVGNVQIGNTDTILGVVQYLEFLFSFYFKKAEALFNTIYIIGGAAGAFRREVFEKVGPYNAKNITEDIELSVRIQAHGMKIAYASDALVFTEGAVTMGGLMKQRLRWKRGRFETFTEHRHMFFSTKPEHNKILSWVILPLAIFGELQLSLEVLFLAFLYIYSFLTGDYTSFLSGLIVVSSMFIIQVAFDNHRHSIKSFLLLAPIGWLLFYISTFVETNALFRSIWGYTFKSEVKWQKWERQGVFSTPKTQT